MDCDKKDSHRQKLTKEVTGNDITLLAIHTYNVKMQLWLGLVCHKCSAIYEVSKSRGKKNGRVTNKRISSWQLCDGYIKSRSGLVPLNWFEIGPRLMLMISNAISITFFFIAFLTVDFNNITVFQSSFGFISFPTYE